MLGTRTSTGSLIETVFFAASIFVASMSGATARADEPAAGKQVSIDVFGKGKLQVPAEFKRIQPKSQIVQHEFEASTGEGKDAEIARVTMMEAGGDVKANVRRWKGQFTGGDKEANKSEEISIGPWAVHIVDLNGSYGESMGGGPFAGGKVVQRENYRDDRRDSCSCQCKCGKPQILYQDDRTGRRRESESGAVDRNDQISGSIAERGFEKE